MLLGNGVITFIRNIIITLLIVVIGVIGWSVRDDFLDAQSHAEHKLVGSVRVVAEHAARTFGETSQVLDSILDTVEDRGGWQALNENKRYELFKRVIHNIPQIGSVFVVDDNANLTGSSLEHPIRKLNLADRDYFKFFKYTSSDKLFISDVIINRIDGTYRINTSRRITNSDGSFGGVLVVSLSCRYFEDFYSGLDMLPPQHTGLIRDDGQFLALFPFKDKMLDISLKETALFKTHLPLSSEGVFRTNGDSIEPEHRIVAFKRLPDNLNLIAVASCNLDDVLMEWFRSSISIALIGLICCMIIVLLGRMLIKRLRQLKEADEKVLRVSKELEEERYQTILATAIDGFWMVDISSGQLQHVNNAYCRMSGYSCEELLAMKISDLEITENSEQTREHIAKIVRSGGDRFESRHRRKDGTAFEVEISASYLHKDQRAIAFIRDISGKKSIENSLHQQSAVLTGVLESTDSAIFSVDFSLKYTSFNTAHMKVMQELYGVEIRLETPILDYMKDEDRNVARENLLRALTGETFIIEAESGDSRLLRTVFEISHNPIRNELNEVTGVAVFARDISGRKRVEQSLHELQSQMMQNDKLATIGQLAAGVAHEINNPMGFVSSNMATLGKYIEKYNRYIEQLEEGVRDAATGKLPEQIRALRHSLKLDYVMRDISVLVAESNEGIERVKSIVQDLRTFSHADTVAVRSADLNSCIDSTINIVINEIRYVADLKRDYGVIPRISCNAQQLNQVFMNLLINAAHAIRTKGDELGEIDIRTWCDSDNVHIAISDNGCGIAPENCGRIFDAFFTTKDVGMGTGLGLSISSSIVRKHGGEIMLTSEVGIGTTFTVRLPLQPTQPGVEF
jgi:PAS domain S-box-containing protein